MLACVPFAGTWEPQYLIEAPRATLTTSIVGIDGVGGSPRAPSVRLHHLDSRRGQRLRTRASFVQVSHPRTSTRAHLKNSGEMRMYAYGHL